MGPVRIEIPRERIAEFCRKHRVRRLSLFGSALRDDFRPDSDVDFLVSFAEDAHYSLFDLATMEEELGAILGRKMDLVEREAIEQSRDREAARVAEAELTRLLDKVEWGIKPPDFTNRDAQRTRRAIADLIVKLITAG